MKTHSEFRCFSCGGIEFKNNAGGRGAGVAPKHFCSDDCKEIYRKMSLRKIRDRNKLDPSYIEMISRCAFFHQHSKSKPKSKKEMVQKFFRLRGNMNACIKILNSFGIKNQADMSEYLISNEFLDD